MQTSFQYNEDKKSNQEENSIVDPQEVSFTGNKNPNSTYLDNRNVVVVSEEDLYRRAKTEANETNKSPIKEKEGETNKKDITENITYNSHIFPHHQRDDSKNILYSMLEKHAHDLESNHNSENDTGIRELKSTTPPLQGNKIAVLKDQSQPKPIPYDKEALIGSAYCVDCMFEIPLRARHCRECEKCVATFDHHCSWVSNCIGEKNKYIFHLFLFFHSAILAFAIIYVSQYY